MTSRPVFIAHSQPPWYRAQNVEFEWHRGMHYSRRQLSMMSLHNALNALLPDLRVLEASTYSHDELGRSLSALNLCFCDGPFAGCTVEAVYQASKKFANGGPYRDLMLPDAPRNVKRDPRLTTSGPLVGFSLDNHIFPADGSTLFYDYVYLSALFSNAELLSQASNYQAFTDIAFNPKTMVATQARSIAIGVSLAQFRGSLPSGNDLINELQSDTTSIGSQMSIF